MAMNFSLCGSLCENLFLTITCGNKKKKEKKEKKEKNGSMQNLNRNVRNIILDINALLVGPDFDRSYICNHILNKLIQITGSEYGFIGKIVEEDGKPVLYTYAITNIAWNAASRKFFLDYENSTLRFDNMNTLFGKVITSGEYKIVNEYDSTRCVQPIGHPFTKRFMGVPSLMGGKPVALLGVCNKLTKYTKKDVVNVSTTLDLLSYLFIDLKPSSSFTNIGTCPMNVLRK